jgi:hypothetical protein
MQTGFGSLASAEPSKSSWVIAFVQFPHICQDRSAACRWPPGAFRPGSIQHVLHLDPPVGVHLDAMRLHPRHSQLIIRLAFHRLSRRERDHGCAATSSLSRKTEARHTPRMTVWELRKTQTAVSTFRSFYHRAIPGWRGPAEHRQWVKPEAAGCRNTRSTQWLRSGRSLSRTRTAWATD